MCVCVNAKKNHIMCVWFFIMNVFPVFIRNSVGYIGPTLYTVYCTLYTRPVRSNQCLILHIKYNIYLYFSIICINNFYKKIVTFGHESFKV